MSYYKRHAFFCCNQREPLEACCNNHGALEMQAYAKQRIQSLRMDGKEKVRINKAGCLDRCNEGPILVVYPDAIRYTYVDKHDVEEIIDSHVVHGRIVERLKI